MARSSAAKFFTLFPTRVEKRDRTTCWSESILSLHPLYFPIHVETVLQDRMQTLETYSRGCSEPGAMIILPKTCISTVCGWEVESLAILDSDTCRKTNVIASPLDGCWFLSIPSIHIFWHASEENRPNAKNQTQTSHRQAWLEWLFSFHSVHSQSGQTYL